MIYTHVPGGGKMRCSCCFGREHPLAVRHRHGINPFSRGSIEIPNSSGLEHTPVRGATKVSNVRTMFWNVWLSEAFPNGPVSKRNCNTEGNRDGCPFAGVQARGATFADADARSVPAVVPA